MVDDDFEKKMRELKIRQVSEAIRVDPENWAANLEKLGFQWFDDESDPEHEEELTARPNNPRQESLVEFFEGSADSSDSSASLASLDQVLQMYLDEKASSQPNYALIRRYFKEGNERLQKLLSFGLTKYPTEIGLLDDLGYYNEFRNVSGDLIQFYLKACEEESDMGRFEELATDFCINTCGFGFDALIELEQRLGHDLEKGKVIRKIKDDQASQPEVITF